MAYRAPFAARERLLDFGSSVTSSALLIGAGQEVAIASNEGDLRAACGYLRNPVMNARMDRSHRAVSERATRASAASSSNPASCAWFRTARQE